MTQTLPLLKQTLNPEFKILKLKLMSVLFWGGWLAWDFRIGIFDPKKPPPKILATGIHGENATPSDRF